MAQAADTVVRKKIVVQAPIERAFSVFTDRFGDFKPREHNLLGAPITETIFEPRPGGHIYDRAEDGSECRWARILAYEPPAGVVFSGPGWEAVHHGVDGDGGWPLYLDRYAALLSA